MIQGAAIDKVYNGLQQRHGYVREGVLQWLYPRHQMDYNCSYLVCLLFYCLLSSLSIVAMTVCLSVLCLFDMGLTIKNLLN